jgi:hypothetical protein
MDSPEGVSPAVCVGALLEVLQAESQGQSAFQDMSALHLKRRLLLSQATLSTS